MTDDLPKMFGLTDGHLQDLLRSGLTPDSIRRAGFYSSPNVSEVLGYGAGAGLVIPYPDLVEPEGDGPKPEPYARVKLNEAGRDGKKYRSPTKRGNRLYVPCLFDRAILHDIETPLHITEGEKKALKACQEGLPCVALSGVWSWRQQKADASGDRGPMPDLDLIHWEGRTVYIVYDSDLATNTSVLNAEKALGAELERRGAFVEAIRLPGGPNGEKVGLDDFLIAHSVEAFNQIAPVPVGTAPSATAAPAGPAKILGMGGGTFLRKQFPPIEHYVEGLLLSEGGGFIGGEEKVGKSFFAVELALGLVLGVPVCGRYEVPQRRRVLFIEEEDPERRLHVRLQALLRGHGYDPDDPALQDELESWLHISVWEGFSFDKPDMVQRLHATLTAFQPEVIFVDVLRKVTGKDLNKSTEASQVVEALDVVRRQYGNPVILVLHHFRKSQGVRSGRGSQELNGSYVLGAWVEQSLYFEPINARDIRAGVKVEVQSKDAEPLAPFKLTFESEGPKHAPTSIRLVATEQEVPDPGKHDEAVYQAIATVPPESEPTKGNPGVSVAQIAKATGKNPKLVSRTINRLLVAERIAEAGSKARAKLYIALRDGFQGPSRNGTEPIMSDAHPEEQILLDGIEG